MIFSRRFYTSGLLCLFSLAWAASAFAQEPINQNLVLNQSATGEIKGGETHSYALNIGANQTARIEIIQKGVDVSLAATNPRGERFIETESPSGLFGDDLILVTAREAGEYRISVEVSNPKAATGKYQIKLTEIRPTTPLDNQINEAAKRISEVAQETNVLRAKGTREGRVEAIEKFREVARLAKVKQDKVWEIVAALSSGFIAEQLGEFQKSLDFYLEGLRLAREAGNREYEGTALNNLGSSSKTLGDYEQAILYVNQALAIDRELGNRAGEAIELSNLGGSYLHLGDLGRAEQLYRESLVLRRAVKDQKGEGTTLNNLGQVFLGRGDYAKAIEILQQSLELRRAISDRQGEAVTLRNLGVGWWNAGDRQKAFEYFEQANRMGRELGDRQLEAESFYRLAVAERERGNPAKAIEMVESGLRLVEQIRGELVNPELRTAYFSTVQQFYDLYSDLLVARYEKTKDGGDVALALQMSERARTRGLLDLLKEARVDIRRGAPAKTLERAFDLQNSINQKYRQRTQLLSRKASEEQVSKITNEINSATAELEILQTRIRRDNPRYADLTQGATLTAQEIQNLLDDETVLLEYKLAAPRSFLWLVSKDRIKIYTLPARDAIETTARAFYDAITSRDKTKENQTAELSNKLGQILLAPVAADIENKRLAIVADGVLQFIPFAALTSPEFKVQSPKSEISNEIVVLPSASVLAELRRGFNQSKTPEKTIAIFADPIFERNDPRLAAVSNVAAAAKPIDLRRVARDFNFGETLPRLLSSRIEARNISALAPKNQATSNVDFDASRANATNENLANYRIVHFATHGLLDSARPEFSGLVFSLYDRDGKPQDGFLRLDQIYNLNLNSDLIVLSACQTALGKDVRGEGLIGLTRGFMYAGARRVVATLWKVDDAATAEFMRRFYQNFLQNKLSAAAALRQTQNEMKKIPRFRAPYFWAGFTLQGDWK